MPLRTKFLIANVLMGLGLVPLASCVAWTVASRASLEDPHSAVPMIDPIGMIGLSMTCFFITFAVAGTGAAWSWDLARANPHAHSRTALAFRLATVTIMLSPFVLLTLSKFL